MRLFLKGDPKAGQPRGDIDEYAGVTIDWIRGKRAVLTIFDDNGKSVEDIPLYELKTREEMHKLMIDKGFVKKTRGQKVAQMQVERTEKQLRQIEGSFSLYDTITGLYIVVFVVVTAGAVGIVLNGRKRKRTGTTSSSYVSRV